MKDKFRNEYFRRAKLILKSKTNGRNKIMALNTWAVSILRYGAGILKWNKNELQKMDRKTRKFMTMNKELHPRSDVTWLYVSWKNGGRGLEYENFVKSEKMDKVVRQKKSRTITSCSRNKWNYNKRENS